MSIWAGIVAAFGTVGMVMAGLFAARATTRAAAATAEATQAAARVQAEPNQRAADLAAFRAIRDDMQGEVDELRSETRSLRSLVRAFAWYVNELTMQMRGHGIEPQAPPPRVDDYNRTGV
jgi:ABC-type protease/lipase transport system fused ATPase/permease subunit